MGYLPFLGYWVFHLPAININPLLIRPSPHSFMLIARSASVFRAHDKTPAAFPFFLSSETGACGPSLGIPSRPGIDASLPEIGG